MREKPRDSSRLRHILLAIDNVAQFTDGKIKADLGIEPMLFFAVVKNIEIVGEASYMLTQKFRDDHPNTPWKAIIGMRHVLVHGYYQVGTDEIWNVAVHDLPNLRPQIVSYLNEFDQLNM